MIRARCGREGGRGVDAAFVLAAVCNMLGPQLLGAAVADTIAGIV